MAKKNKPFPKFIVSNKSGHFYQKVVADWLPFNTRLVQVIYKRGGTELHFSKYAFDQQLLDRGYRRPTSTERLLFEQE